MVRMYKPVLLCPASPMRYWMPWALKGELVRGLVTSL